MTRAAPRPAAHAVPRHLHLSGVDGVVAPVPARTGDLFVTSHGLTWSVYPFIDGVDGWGGRMAVRHWQRLGAVLRAAHRLTPPRRVLDELPRPGWDTARYDVLAVRDERVRGSTSDTGVPTDFVAEWERHRGTVRALLDQMRTLAGYLRDRPGEQVVCHGDLHPGNLLIDGERVHLIDWDDVLLAPRERDLIFVPHDPRDPHGPTGGAAGPGRPVPLARPFRHGYGLRSDQIDWAALTYYRCERVVTDVIEWANQALGLTTDDPDTRAEATGWLRRQLAPGNDVDAVLLAARHLPAHLNILSPAR